MNERVVIETVAGERYAVEAGKADEIDRETYIAVLRGEREPDGRLIRRLRRR